MTPARLSNALLHLIAESTPGDSELTDGELLTRYLSSRCEVAVAALVHRYAQMVWGVCCRQLPHRHDAEDAFQATFLVLVHKAASVTPREAVGNWLYGVAHKTALRVRTANARRAKRERQVDVLPEHSAPEQQEADLLHLVDDEIARLPDKYRTVLVLCDLQGLTRKEVAERLELPEGTVASRLARARELLGKRMVRRAVAITAATAGGVPGAATAGVPSAVLTSTIKAAHLTAAGEAVAGVISPSVAALTTGVMKAMSVNKFKIVLAALSVAAIALGGVVLGAAGAHDTKEPLPEYKQFFSVAAKAPVPRALDPDKHKVRIKLGQELSIRFNRDGDGLKEPTVLKADDETAHIAIKFVTTTAGPGAPPRKGAVRPYLELNNKMNGVLQFHATARDKNGKKLADFAGPVVAGKALLQCWEFDSPIEEILLDQFDCDVENPLFRHWPKVEGTAVTFDRTVERSGGVPGGIETRKVTYKLTKATPKELTLAVGERTFTIPAQVDADDTPDHLPRLIRVEDVKVGNKTYSCKVYEYRTSLAEMEWEPDGRTPVSATVWITSEVPGGIVRRKMSWSTVPVKASFFYEDTFASSARAK